MARTSLPVVQRAQPRQLVGNITLRDMLKARMRHIEEEKRRQRVLPSSLIVPRWLRRSPGIPASGQLGSVAPGQHAVERQEARARGPLG